MPVYEESEITTALEILLEMRDANSADKAKYNAMNLAMNAISNKIVPVTPKIDGETSDGYHTFNELYHHRAVLFAFIVAHYPELCWKTKHHHDGSMYDGMFIVGMNTPDGMVTYHYDLDPYWDYFDCKEVDYAPVWDGHTPAQAIERINNFRKLLCDYNHGRYHRTMNSYHWVRNRREPGTHTCRLTLMRRNFCGHVTFPIKGTCRGGEILEPALRYLRNPGKFESDCQLTYIGENRYSLVLSNGKSTLAIGETDYRNLYSMIVAVEISDFELERGYSKDDR